MDHAKKASCPKIVLLGTFQQLYHLLVFPLLSMTSLEIPYNLFLSLCWEYKHAILYLMYESYRALTSYCRGNAMFLATHNDSFLQLCNVLLYVSQVYCNILLLLLLFTLLIDIIFLTFHCYKLWCLWNHPVYMPFNIQDEFLEHTKQKSVCKLGGCQKSTN